MIFPTQKQLDLFKKTPGAISVCEMVAIMNVVAKAPDGVFAEMGSHRGKSGSATAMAMAAHHGTVLHMVDPLYSMDDVEVWKHACQGHPDNAWQGAKEADFKDTVRGVIREASDGMVEAALHGDYSTRAIPHLYSEFGAFAYVLLDSDIHTYELTKEELGLLRERMVVGGIIGFHDFQSQFTGVEQAYREMLTTVPGGPVYEEVPIDWPEIVRWARENGGEAGSDSWHHTEMEFPCFFGALRRVK